MLRSDWITQAEEWEAKAREAYDTDNETWGEYCQMRAHACRSAADHAPESEATHEAEGGNRICARSWADRRL